MNWPKWNTLIQVSETEGLFGTHTSQMAEEGKQGGRAAEYQLIQENNLFERKVKLSLKYSNLTK